MKVLFDHQAFSRQRFGGVSRYFHGLANGLQSLEKVQVEVFAPWYVCEYVLAGDPVQPRGLRTRPFPRTGWLRRRVDDAISALASRPRTDVDLFHETYYTRADSKPRTARRVITVFDMIHERFPQHFAAADPEATIKLAAIRRADHIVCISQSTQRDLLALTDLDSARTSVVYPGNGLDFSNSPTPSAGLKGRDYLLFVGHRAGYKNFAVLLEAFAASTVLRANLMLVCFGGPAFSAEESARVAALGLGKQVIHRGGSDLALAGYYAAAAALVCPSLHEGFGMPVLEAMALGCPVLCANAGSLPEVAGGAALYFDPQDVAALRQAAEDLLDRSVETRARVEQGRQRAQAFTWAACAAQTAAVYGRL